MVGPTRRRGERFGRKVAVLDLGFLQRHQIRGRRAQPLGQVLEAHSVSAGLDYPGVGPEHSYFKDQQLVRYENVSDEEAMEAFHLMAQTEGIIPALESAHGLAWIVNEASSLRGKTVVLNLSGRGDKDVQQVAALYD